MQDQLAHDEFLRLLLKSEREVLRYIVAIVPNVAEAQEIFQETAIALWAQIDQFDRSKAFTPWACRFAANKAKEHLRKQGRWKGFLDPEIAAELLARREQIAPELDRRIRPLQDCLTELPANSRTIVSRYYFDQLSTERIARESNRTVESIYKTLQRVRSALMDCVNSKLAAEATR